MAPTASRQDVMAEIERQFGGSERTAALKTVNLLTGVPGDRERVQLGILQESAGNLGQLRSLVDAAKRNPRRSATAPAEPARGGAPGVTDAVSARAMQVAAIASLAGAHRGADQDPSAAVGSSKEYPPYRFIFYVAIALIPVLTLGGAIPAGIAGAGIGGCRKFATDANRPHGQRIMYCIGITIACWVLLFALVGGVVLFRSS